MANERAFDLHRAKAMACNFNNVIDATKNPNISVLITLRSVTGEIDSGDAAPVFASEAFIVAINGAQHRRPRLLDGEISGLAWRHRFPLQVNYACRYSGKRQRSGARFRWRCAGKRRNHDRAGFGLPPG